MEASKFTEVGYVGRDVESMVRDLVELAVTMVRDERLVEVQDKARANAEERLLDLLVPPARPAPAAPALAGVPDPPPDPRALREAAGRTREKLRDQLRSGGLDSRVVELEIRESSFPSFEVIAGSSIEEIDVKMKDMLPGLFQGRNRKRRMKVPEAAEHLARRGGAEARRHGERRPRRHRAGGAGGNHLRRRD